MSFFGVDAVPNKHSTSQEFDLNDAEAYDDLANQLVEDNDDLNDETFGDVSITVMDKDFDFAGQTARVSDTIDEEQFVYAHTNKAVNPGSSSLMNQNNVGMSNVPGDAFGGAFKAPSQSVQARSFQPIPGLWDSSAQQNQAFQQPDAAKDSKPQMLSVEEIEAQMFSANSQAHQHPSNQQQQLHAQQQQFGVPPGMFYNQFPPGTGYPPQQQQQLPPQQQQQGGVGNQPFPVVPPGFPANTQFGPPFPQDPSGNNPLGFPMPQGQFGGLPPQDQSGVQGQPMAQRFVNQPQNAQLPPNTSVNPSAANNNPNNNNNNNNVNAASSSSAKPYDLNAPAPASGNAPASFSQVMALDAAKSSSDSARLLNKSRRIAHQYKYNNLMTSFDKSLITRIQLNRIVTEDPYNEDFYYLVSSQFQARSNPHQPLNEFAKTYLFQRGKGTFQFGGGGRNRRGQDNPLQRMHQQVQQAVAYARDHPQKEQISLEGSLGKISLNSAKKPRQSLVLKKLVAKDENSAEGSAGKNGASSDGKGELATPESLTKKGHQQSTIPVPTDSRSLLLLIENMYNIVLEIESIERSKSAIPQQPALEKTNTAAVAAEASETADNKDNNKENVDGAEAKEKVDHKEAKLQEQYQILWSHLEAVTLESDASKKSDSGANNSNNNAEFGNSFIEILKHRKGKRLIPRIFRHLNPTQRLTILTRIVHHLDSLDVVKDAVYVDGEDLKPNVKENVELFVQTVLPPLVHIISESEFGVVIGLLEILILSNNVPLVACSKIGLSILTVLISQAEYIAQEDSKNSSSSNATTSDPTSAASSSSPSSTTNNTTNSTSTSTTKSVDPTELANWKSTFNSLFSLLESHLASIFPPRRVDDSYVWHFLASLALAASLDHQRVIVDQVREKIFGTMAEAKALPPDMCVQKIANLNLFLNVMGLNATTTEIGQLCN